jgi:DNA-binding GntR family transcriptional regulator
VTGARGRARRLPRRLSDGRPKGEQLREILEAQAASLAPGSPLPSERELAERYGVARMTVRGEIERLTSEGVIYRAHGRGTFVAEPRVAQAMTLTSFTEDMRGRGMEPSSRVLGQEPIDTGEALAARLEVPPGTATVQLDRVRLADGIAMAYEQAYLPADRFPGIEATDFSGVSLFDLLSERWAVELGDADQRVVATAIEGEEAALLEVPEGQPGLRFRTLARDRSGVPVYYAVTLYRGDRYEIELRQVRPGRTEPP